MNIVDEKRCVGRLVLPEVDNDLLVVLPTFRTRLLVPHQSTVQLTSSL